MEIPSSESAQLVRNQESIYQTTGKSIHTSKFSYCIIRFLINSPRNLLYSLCLSGDGNFHLQSRVLVKNIIRDPSFFGDSGLFVPYQTYKDYTAAAETIEDSKNVSKEQDGFWKTRVPVTGTRRLTNPQVMVTRA
jgi:hypothetical protein